MAYNESTIGGSSGGQFRVWINSIRTHRGGAGENFEEWRAEGGIKRVTAGSRIWNLNNQATYNVQLGMNGVNKSGNFSYDFASGYTGPQHAWGTGTTRVYRNSAGVGFGFQSRMDINLANSPYLTSGWVTSNDNVDTVYREANLSALSMDAGGIPATDEGPLWLEFSNPGGATVQAFLEAPSPSFPRIYTSANGIGSRFNFPNLSGGSLTTALQNAIPNSNTGTLRIGIYSQIGGHNTYDFRDRSYTIKNDTGQANPLFADFDYVDENSVTVAITGNNQVLIQDNGNPSVPKSDLKVTVAAADKATARKGASMSSYLFSIGAYSQSEPWSNSVDVVKDIGQVGDVSGAQTLNVRAIDSRGNGTTVSKNVTVLPYASPGFYNNLGVKYANDFDADDGLEVNLFNNEVIGSISPMTLSGVDKNAVTPTTGLRFDMAKDTGSFSGTWTNIAYTQEAGTGIVTVNPATLATQLETKMNAMGADNTVRWFILFEIQDKLETQYFTVDIDVGRPFFRIGADGRLYYKEIEFFQTFSGDSSLYYPAILATGITGTWTLGTPPAVRAGGWSMFANTTSAAIGNECYVDIYVPAGTFNLIFYADGASVSGQTILNLDNQIIFTSGPNHWDTYHATGAQFTFTTGNINFLDGATYRMYFYVNNKQASSTSYQFRLLGIKLTRIGFNP